MDIEKVLKELDSLPLSEQPDSPGIFLEEKIKLAHDEGDYSSEITLLNEMIGYCRYAGKYDAASQYSDAVLKLCQDMKLEGTISYATTLLNIANADRAAGRLDRSGEFYKRVEQIYDEQLDEKDYLYAALYNNMSLLYQTNNDYVSAVDALEKSLTIIGKIPGEEAAVAITHTNLAQALLRLDRIEEGKNHLISAEYIFEELGGDDFHYPGCLNALGDVSYLEGNLRNALKYYERALELLYDTVGDEAPSYQIVRANYDTVKRAALNMNEELIDSIDSIAKKYDDTQRDEQVIEASAALAGQGIELSRKYYEKYGFEMIHEQFFEYEDRMTIGLVGKGSECFGFDDEYSKDHDYGPGFCIWLDDEDYRKIGDRLQRAYDLLPNEFMGYKRIATEAKDGRRTGVFRSVEFYSHILNVDEKLITNCADGDVNDIIELCEAVKEEDLATVTNGVLFNKGYGIFVRLREQLSYYPDSLWRRRLAVKLHECAQLGQYNYQRMLDRQDKVAADIILGKYMESILQLTYLINKKYAPYYKWLKRGVGKLDTLAVIGDILDAIHDMNKDDERIPMTIEIIATQVAAALRDMGLCTEVSENENFLDTYSDALLG